LRRTLLRSTQSLSLGTLELVADMLSGNPDSTRLTLRQRVCATTEHDMFALDDRQHSLTHKFLMITEVSRAG
jgi:hypothetical protein